MRVAHDIGVKQRHADDEHQHGGFTQRCRQDRREILDPPHAVESDRKQSKNRAKACRFPRAWRSRHQARSAGLRQGHRTLARIGTTGAIANSIGQTRGRRLSQLEQGPARRLAKSQAAQQQKMRGGDVTGQGDAAAIEVLGTLAVRGVLLEVAGGFPCPHRAVLRGQLQIDQCAAHRDFRRRDRGRGDHDPSGHRPAGGRGQDRRRQYRRYRPVRRRARGARRGAEAGHRHGRRPSSARCSRRSRSRSPGSGPAASTSPR